MKFNSFAAVLFILIPSVTSNDIEDVYIGCYKVDVDNKVYSLGGGNYHFNLLNVKQCISLCRSVDQTFAACQAGRLCRCGSELAQLQNVSRKDCTIRCSGEVLDMCGGSGGFVSVYSTEHSVKTLTILDPGVIQLYQRVTINTTLEDGHDGAVFSYDWGDSTQSPFYTPRHQPHVYTDEGIYLVRVNASNNISGPIEARLNVFAESPIRDLHTECDKFVEVGFTFNCWNYFGQGTNVEVSWDFGDGSEKLKIKMQDAERFSTAPVIPHHLDYVNPPVGFQGAYVVPQMSFSETGKIETWEVFASSEGQVKLQIFHPLCDTQERYCAYNRSCVSRFLSCLPANEESCDAGNEAFCVRTQTCQPFSTQHLLTQKNRTITVSCPHQNNSMIGNTSLTNHSDCNATTWETYDQWQTSYHPGECQIQNESGEPWQMGYYLVGENLVYLKEGYNIFEITTADRIQVEIGDVIGFSTYRQKFPQYYPKAAYPLIGEVALKGDRTAKIYLLPQTLDRSMKTIKTMDAEYVLSGQLYLRARGSITSYARSTHSYTQSGMFSIQTEYDNALPGTITGPSVYIASQYSILSIKGTHFTRDLGRYYACTDEAFEMHVEVHQGTFVRLVWEFPDGDSNVTAPYIHNGIEDGPEVNTPDNQPFLFYEIGNYSTSVTAYNNVSSAMVKLDTTARYRIRGLCGFIVNMKEDNTTQGWNLTMAGTYFNFTSLITSGNEVEYLWLYGDGSDSVLWSPVLFYTHYYQTAGLYTVTVKADNIASTMDYSFQVEAVKPNIVHAPLYSTSDIPFQAVCDVTWHTGRGLTFLWDFGDGNTSAVWGLGEVWHYYTTFNTYTITCTIDDFPDVSDTFVIIDQDPVEGVKLDNITDIKATGDVVEFAVTWTRGNDVSFYWSFGEDEDEVRTNEPEVTHVYANTGFYDVIVNVSNVVSWMMSPPLRIELQERITGLRVTSGNNIIFADVAAQASSDTGNKVVFTYFFGDGFNVSSSSREESHRYSNPDLYTITVDAYNAVSLQRSQASVLIDSRITQGRVLVETPWIRADLVRANCWAMNGSSVWMNFDWGDGEVTGPYYANFVGTGSNFEGSHYYSKEGTFNITCYMGNAWSDAVARTQVLLQESIGSILFEPSVTVKGDIFYFKVLPFVGGGHDVLFQWDYNDGSYYTSQDFTHPYVYSKAGIYYVKLTTTNLVSTKTVTQQLYVQEHVTGLYLSPVHPVEPGQPSIVTWQIEHGTDVEYQVDLGDDTDPYIFRQSVIGKSYILEYIYNYPGSYQVSLSVWNKLNSLNQTATAHVEYPIQGLRAYIIGNSTTHTDKSAFITIEIDQGTNVIFTCDYRDGSAPIVTTKMFCRHMFIALGYHLVTVSAENHLSSANCAANQSYEVILPPIPQRIENLEIVVEQSTILGHVTVFRMKRRRGNRYNCTWSYGDGDTEEMDQSMVFDLFNHTYATAGIYLASINCSNFYNPPVEAFANVTVQESVRGLNFSCQLLGQYHTNLTLTISLDGGTDAEAEVYFNNGVFIARVVHLAGIVVIPGKAVNVTGWHDISLVARNMVPPEMHVEERIYIEAEVTNLMMWTETPYITVGSVVEFQVSMDLGTDVYLEWHYGDNFMLETFIKDAKRGDVFSSQHLYTEEGLYAAMVVATNRITTVSNIPLLIAVEDQVSGFLAVSNSPVLYPDGVVNFTVTWNVHTRTLPDNTSIIVDFGTDEIPVEITLDSLPSIQEYKLNKYCIDQFLDYDAGYVEINMTLRNNITNGNNTSNVTTDSTIIRDSWCDEAIETLILNINGSSLHVFGISNQFLPGQYQVSIKIQNMASRQEFKFLVETQIPVRGCAVTVCSFRDGMRECEADGDAYHSSHYPVEYSVVLRVFCINGTGMEYKWSFGDGTLVTSGEHETLHEYSRPGIYTIDLLCSNIFGGERLTTVVTMQESVVGLFMSQGPVSSLQVNVIVFALQPGTNSTFQLSIPTLNFSQIVATPSFDASVKSKAIDRWDKNAHLPFNVSDAAVSFHEVTFPRADRWQVSITGSNFASQGTFEGHISVSEEPCDLPSVEILGSSQDFREPTSFVRYQAILLMAQVQLACSRTSEANMIWMLFPLKLHDGALLPPENSTALEFPSSIVTSEMTFRIDPYVINLGRYMVELTVILDNDGEVNNKQLAFFEVVPSDLVATIAGGDEETIKERSFFSLNGSASHDPDVNTADCMDKELELAWYCHLGNETLDLENGTQQEGKGCFGDGPGQIANETALLTYWTTNLTHYHRFLFTLVVSKEGKEPVAVTKIINVERGSFLPLAIRCVKNCLSKMNPALDLILAAWCDCKANQTEMTYEWNVNGLTTDRPLALYSATGLHSPYLQLSSLLFLNNSGLSFQVSLNSYLGDDIVGQVRNTYRISDLLVAGDCEVSPSTGTVLFTEFVIQCEGFSTSSPPMLYRFLWSRHPPPSPRSSDDVNSFSLLSMSPGGQMPPQSLPAGLKEHNQTVYLRVQVRDTLGVTTTKDMEVQVFPAESVAIEDQLHSIRFGNLSLLGKAVGKGDYQRAAQLISELSASMNNDNEDELEIHDGDATTGIKDRLNQETKEIVRKKMVATLSQVKVLTLELGRQMTSALTSAIAEPNEIELETQENAVEIYSNVLHKLKSEENSAHDPDASNEISSNFLSGASSLLQAASIQSTKVAAEWLTPEPLIPPKEGLVYSERNQLTPPRALGVFGDVNGTTYERRMYLEQMAKIKVLTEHILEMLELTGGLLVRTEVPGETPKMVHNSEELMMAVQKVTILDDINRLYTMPDGSWLRLPAEAIDQVKDAARADNEIITQMYSFPTNPFTWHDDDINILTTVVGLTLKNTNGKELHVSGLTEAIEVLLPRGEHSALKFDTMTAYSHELITVSFNVSEPSSSIHIDVYPADPEQTNRLEAYLRFGFWPTMNTYDIKTVLPIAESDLTVSSFNLTANFTANPYTWFIREEQLYATGSYYLSFRVVNDDAETNSTSLQVDVDVKIYTARCLFWSPSDELWLPDGCQVGTMTTASFTHCLCDHLSFVGGTFSVPPKQQIIFEEVVEVTLDPIKTNVAVFITLVISALSVICILFACIADCVSRNKLYKDLEICEDLYIVRTFTGLRCNAGSTAKISIILHGENISSNPILLSNDDGRAFRSGSVDTFMAATIKGLGEIIKLSVSQNGQGFSPSWHFSRVVVKHHKSGREWMFLCNSQLKKPNTVLTFKAASTHQTVKHRHLFTTQSLLMTLSNQIPWLTVFMRYAWDPFSYKECVCTFVSALLLVPCLTTLFKDILFSETPPTTNEFALHTDSMIHGGMIGGAVLVVYHVLGVLYSSIQPKLPTPPRSARDHEAARDDNVNVKLKKVVKSSASLQDIIVEPKGIHLSLQGLDDAEWAMGTSDTEEWDLGSKGNLNNSGSPNVSLLAVETSVEYCTSDWNNASSSLLTSERNQDSMNIHGTALIATSSNQSDLPECDRLTDTNIQSVPVAAPSDKLTQRSYPTTELNTFTVASEQGTDKLLPQKHGDLNAEPSEVKQYTTSYRQPTITRLTKVQNISTNNANINKEVRFETTRQQQPLESSLSLVCRLVDVCNRISKRRFLPWWVSFLVLPLTIGIISGGAFVSYYFIYDVHTIDSMFRWVTTCGVATAIFAFVPLLLACSSLFVFSAFGRPCTVWEGSHKFEEEHKSRSSRSKGVSMEAVNRAKHLQTYRIVDDNQDGFMKRVITGGFWILYLVALLILVLRQRSSTDIYAVQNIKRIFNNGLNPDDSINFKQISNFSSFWLWSGETLLPSLVSCSPGKMMNAEEAGSLFRLVTTPRIRQFRVDRSIAGDCRNSSPTDLGITDCLTKFNDETEDKQQYLNSWSSPPLTEAHPGQEQGYRYYSQEETKGTTMTGSLGAFHAGGYVVEIPPESGTSLYILTNLKDRLWLDENTRAILVEFALFNSDIELTCVVQLLLESSPTGYLMPAMEVRCFHVREHGTLWGMAYQCLDGLVILIAVCLLFQELGSLHLMGRSYYGDLGCWTNLLTFLASSGAAAAIVIQHLASANVSLATPEFALLSEMSMATSWYISAISLAIFMVMIQQIALLNLNTYLYILSSTVKQTTSSMISASPFFVTFVLSATWTGWMLFSGDLFAFHTHYDALMTLLNARLGYLEGTQVSQGFRLHVFFLINVTLCGFFGLFAFSVTAMKSYSLLRVRHAFGYFIDHGKLTELAQKMKTRMLTRITLGKVRRRKREIARTLRHWRNKQSLDAKYAKKLNKMNRKAYRLLATYQSENKLMVENVPLLVEVTSQSYEEWKRSK